MTTTNQTVAGESKVSRVYAAATDVINKIAPFIHIKDGKWNVVLPDSREIVCTTKIEAQNILADYTNPQSVKERYTGVTTTHGQVGYTNNVNVVERALRERFGFNDNSHVQIAVAAHIWSQICPGSICDDKAEWSQVEVENALNACEARLQNLRKQLPIKAARVTTEQLHMNASQKKVANAIEARDSVRNMAAMNSAFESELHAMANRLDVLAKQIGVAELLKRD